MNSASFKLRIFSVFVLCSITLILTSCQQPKVIINDVAVSAISPKKQSVEKVQAGETVFVEAQVTKTPQSLDVTYKWETNGGKFEPTSEREPSGYYTAPDKTGEKYFIRLITLHKGKELDRKTIPVLVVEKVEAVSEQKPPEVTMPPTPTEKKELVTIIAPGDASEVGMITSVRGRVTELKPGERLVILVKRASEKQWQVTAIDPAIKSGGTWAVDEIQLGEPQDTGQTFQIIAVITTQTLSPGQLLESLPAEQSKIVSVKRRAEEPEAVTIISPKDVEAVDMIITVKGKVRKLLRNENLIVLIRPIPDDPNQSWWVQSSPVIKQDGTWTSSPVYVGIATDRGVPFRILAVITSERVARGDQLPAPPDGPRYTVDIKRR